MDSTELRCKLLNDGILMQQGTVFKVNPWLSRKGRSLEQYFSENRETYAEYLDSGSVEAAVYRIVHDMEDRPVCGFCGEPRKFMGLSRGFAETCGSRECRNRLRERTSVSRFGTAHYSSTEECKGKVRDTSMKRYGVSNYSSTDECRRKVEDTSLRRYGVRSYACTGECRDRMTATLREHYGVDHPLQSDEVRNRSRETCLERYGTDNYARTEECRERMEDTCRERYGVSSYLQTPEFQAQYRRTSLERYGVEHPSRNPGIHRKQFGRRGASGPERKLAECLTNRGIPFIQEYFCNGKNFDFAIFRNDVLMALVEIDGEYCHGLTDDPDGALVQGYGDVSRFGLVPDGVRFIVCDSRNVDRCVDEILRTMDISYEDWIEGIVTSLPREFPYPEYSEDRLRTDYRHLCERNVMKPKARLADSTIRQFHKSIYSAHVGDNPSPLEAWNDSRLLDKCVRNRFIYSSSLSSQSIVNGFNICKIAPKVSVFSASLARRLVRTYLDGFSTVFDPFSGFSGRMLGVCSCGKRYIGQDINPTTISEASEIRSFHGLDTELRCGDVLESSGDYPCLFTCPPYSLKETWNNEGQKDLSCDGWIDVCLRNFTCGAYLFVVDETRVYGEYVVEEISNDSHLGSNREKVILIPGKDRSVLLSQGTN